MKGGSRDPLVVRTDDLARVLEPIVAEQNTNYTLATGRLAGVGRTSGNPKHDPTLTGCRMLEERTGRNLSTLSRNVFAGRTKHTTLDVADLLLTACGQAGALQDGRVPVYKSPIWGRGRWEAEIRARGIDDPWSIVEDEEEPHELAA
jgi:hypothetical protein